MSFLNSALLGLTALFAVPLIIHLLNRRRYQVKAWAAMDFLLKAFRQNKRRMRLENLLLLLLRCLIPILLALAVARPRLSQNAVAIGNTGKHHILLLDRSYSMGYRQEMGLRPFDRMRKLARAVLEHAARSGKDKLSLIYFDHRVTTPVRGDLNVTNAKRALAELQDPSDGTGALVPALKAALEIADGETERQLNIYVFSDFQENLLKGAVSHEEPVHEKPVHEESLSAIEDGAQNPDVSSTRPELQGLKDVVDDLLEKGASVSFLPLAPGPNPANTVVQSLSLDPPNAITNSRSRLRATIVHRGAEAREALVTMQLDGKNPQTRSILLKPGEAQEVDFEVRLLDEGAHSLEVSIDEDALPLDDSRRLVVLARKRISVLIVEGGELEDEDPILQRSFLYDRLLNPSFGDELDEQDPPDAEEIDQSLLVFSTRVVDELRFQSDPGYLTGQDLVVLVNVSSLREGPAAQLSRFVARGGGLFIAPGPDSQTDLYNLRLFGKAGEKGPLPLRLVGIQGYLGPLGNAKGAAIPSRYATARIRDIEHPVLLDFKENETLAKILELTPIYRYWGMSMLDKPKATQIILGLDSPWSDSSAVLLASRAYGRGRCILLGSNISQRPDRWNRLEGLWLSLPLLHSSCHYLAQEPSRHLNRIVGETISTHVDQRPRALYLHRPENQGRIPLNLAQLHSIGLHATGGRRVSFGELGWMTPPYHGTALAGFYRLEVRFEEESKNTENFLFAINPDPDEGILSYLSPGFLDEEFPEVKIQSELVLEAAAVVDSGVREIGRYLLILALIIAISESLLASWIRRKGR